MNLKIGNQEFKRNNVILECYFFRKLFSEQSAEVRTVTFDTYKLELIVIYELDTYENSYFVEMNPE